MATTNYTNDRLIAYSGDINTAPDKFTTLTGSMTTNGVFVTGAGTLFLTEIGGDAGVGQPTKSAAGGWIFNGTDEVRQITAVVDNTHLTINKAFTVDIVAGRVVKYVAPSRSKQMSFVTISGTVLVDGVTMASSEGSGWGDTTNTNMRTVDPVIIDSSAGVAHVTKFMSN